MRVFLDADVLFNSANDLRTRTLLHRIMFSEYIGATLRQAKYESLENGSYTATVEGLRGVIATGETIEKCREDLIEVIEEWITIRLQRGFAIPDLDGHAVGVSQEPMAVVWDNSRSNM